MATTRTVSSMVDAPHRSPLLFLAAIVSVILMGAGAFYLGLQKSAITEEQKKLDDEIATLHTEIAGLESQKIEAAQLAQQWLESIEREEILWSKVFTRIQALIPLDTLTSEQKIKFSSYSGSQGGKISLNAQTRAAQQDPFADVSELISVFNTSSFFSGAYVPSITRGETETGDKILSFLFNMTYQEEEPEVLANPTPPLVSPTPTSPSATPPSVVTPSTSPASPEPTPAAPDEGVKVPRQ